MIKIFLNYVEIRTKIATVIPFIIAVLIYLTTYSDPNYYVWFVFFIALLLLDMSTTALNNYVSLTRAIKKNHLDNELMVHINNKKITKNTLLFILLFMATLGTLISFYLVYLTNINVLLIGLLCGFIAITYSYGPLPIFRTPLGELYSGGADALLIPYLVFATQQEYIFTISDNIITIDIIESIKFLILFLPLFFCVSNIMLANNICDREEDLHNGRYTLPVLLGSKKSLFIFKYSYILAVLFIVFASLINILPIYFLAILLVLYPVLKNVKIFEQKQEKQTTFLISLKNFIIISSMYIILLIISILF